MHSPILPLTYIYFIITIALHRLYRHSRINCFKYQRKERYILIENFLALLKKQIVNPPNTDAKATDFHSHGYPTNTYLGSYGRLTDTVHNVTSSFPN